MKKESSFMKPTVVASFTSIISKLSHCVSSQPIVHYKFMFKNKLNLHDI